MKSPMSDALVECAVFDLYQVDVRYFCAGVEVQDNIIIRAAPILRWACGKPLSALQSWVKTKRGTCILIP